ncbi:LysR family transcriptional regulator [Hansschlegelia plantiphila]|uniref:LysR family transcriptional regulator n=1 Tax=Hansschlegelia plantiphila TaxID=374655 RepID=A0A9W6MU27_9HYPH|nr:LysR family transcriptional regulator [Hansschlegelia plantiphila]GLK66522.1 LysR family transcriptional regulator [Hansschlegelia plantiphila]
MSFTLRQLRYFIAVAEGGTVSGAAQELAVSQSAVTESIKALELDLGVLLFERRRRGLSVTYEGQQFHRHARRILSAVSDARQSLGSDAAEQTGSLNFGVTTLVAGYVLSDLLERYRRAHPEIALRAIEDGGEYLEHLLIGGELDVAIMDISNRRDHGALQVEVIESSSYKLWLPIGHRLAESEIVAAAELDGEKLIALSVDEIADGPERLLAALGARPEIAFRTRSVEAVRSLVATGAGVALLPDLFYRPWSLEGDRIESRRLAETLPVIQVGVAWRRGSALPQAAQDFVAMARFTRPQRSRAPGDIG